jgi:hypothetical protein
MTRPLFENEICLPKTADIGLQQQQRPPDIAPGSSQVSSWQRPGLKCLPGIIHVWGADSSLEGFQTSDRVAVR